MRNLLSELRRRNVLRVAAAYALSAWILIEAGSVLLPTFGASERVFQVYVIIVIAGFVAAVVLSWLFEWTPEGVKRDSDVERAATGDPRSGQKLNYAIIALLVVALTVSITFNVREQASTPRPRSIAVLPLNSLSSNPDNDLFTSGIHDDLLSRLANIHSLKVISRTSVMEYRDTTKNVRQIGEELGVESILEGGVQRVGDSVRINLQLIDARTDEHLWAKTYDRRLTMENIFTVQSEISEAVADALQATLSVDEQRRMAAMPTNDLRAYRLFKDGRTNLHSRRLEMLRTAREQFEEAVALDPGYAEAHAGLAESVMLLSINHNDIPPDRAVVLAEASVQRALELDPNLANGYAIRGLINMTVWSRTRAGPESLEAEAAFRRAIALNPNHASAYMWFASLRDNENRLDEAIGLYQRSMELDPLARIPYSNLPLVYAKRGEHHAAMQLWLEAVRIHSDWPTVYEYIAVHLWGLGRVDEACAWYEKAISIDGRRSASNNVDIGILVDLGEWQQAKEAMRSIPENNPFAQLAEGMLELLDGNYEKASEFFIGKIERGLVSRVLGNTNYVYDVASDVALLAGDLETARKYLLVTDPVLGRDVATRVDRFNTDNAVKLAYIEQRRGNTEEARALLLETLAVMRDLPRLGTFGYGIRDVQIYTLLGRREDAIAAFREALDDGFRGSVMFEGWPLGVDPYLESIRDEPRFVAMLGELDGYLAAMHARFVDARAANELDDLRAMAETI